MGAVLVGLANGRADVGAAGAGPRRACGGEAAQAGEEVNKMAAACWARKGRAPGARD